MSSSVSFGGRPRVVFDCLYQLLHGSRQTVELPPNQRVAAAREFEGLMRGGPICNRPRHLLGENLFAPCFGQRVALQDKILVHGRNPSIVRHSETDADLA
jgi:hypothetical protein